MRIGAHHAGDFARGEIAIDRLPALAGIGAAEEIGLVIRELVAGGAEIDRVGVVRGDLDTADVGECGHA